MPQTPEKFSVPKSGEPFNPWHEAFGFYPQDVLGRQRKLLEAAGNLKMVLQGLALQLARTCLRGIAARCVYGAGHDDAGEVQAVSMTLCVLPRLLQASEVHP
jgi:hypothetical protein